MDNRWSDLVSPGPTPVHPLFEDVTEETVTVLRGASEPQRGVTGLSEDEGRLGRFLTDGHDVFWLGVHGGAGESVLADLLGGTACHHRWPAAQTRRPSTPQHRSSSWPGRTNTASTPPVSPPATGQPAPTPMWISKAWSWWPMPRAEPRNPWQHRPG